MKAKNVIIVGNGIAGAATAHALKAEGITPTIITSPSAHRASDIEAAVVSPRFMRQAGVHANYLTGSFAATLQNEQVRKNMLDQKGLTLHPSPDLDAERMRDLAGKLDWPKNWIEQVGPRQHFPLSGAVDAENLIADLLDKIPIIQAHVTGLKHDGQRWCITLQSDGEHYADAVILATGVRSKNLEQLAPLPIGLSRGQTSLYRDQDISAPSGSHAYGGYISPTVNIDGNSVRIVGSSFKKLEDEDTWQDVSIDDRATMQQRATEHTGAKFYGEPITEHVGLRATSPDHLPIVGAVPNWQAFEQYLAPHRHDTKIKLEGNPPYQRGLYVITGLGSKGFQHAFTCGAYLASLVTDGPSPISDATERLLSPIRFLQREIKRSLSK